MVSSFYKTHCAVLLGIVAVSFPFLMFEAESLPTNNDIETWLPGQSEVRLTYDEFKLHFGAEEVILIGISSRSGDDRLLNALCGRLESLSGVRQCWSPDRLRSIMQELGVGHAEIERRLKGFVVSKDETLIGLVALLSDEGLTDRTATVAAIREQLDYCQLRGDAVKLAGASVVVAELDRLSDREKNKKFFLITLLISLCLMYGTLRRWKPALSILGLTVWAVNMSLASIKLSGGEMNFILGALPVMVLVFTLAIAIHFLHYYRASLGSHDPLGDALRLSWKPCCLATLTTTIGLMSLTLSDIAPVRQFGYAASMGSLVALLTGLGLTPAVLAMWPDHRPLHGKNRDWFTNATNWLLDHRKPVSLSAGLLVLIGGVGLLRLESTINPLDFLPPHGKVLSDIRCVERNLTSISSLEAMVDFGDSDLSFVDKLQQVRRLESKIAEHPSVRHTMSAATFLPSELPESPREAARLLRKAQSRRGHNGFLADGETVWRISVRTVPTAGIARKKIFDDLVEMTQGAPITLTGITPLLESAQRAIFDGFWESFAMAFGVISLVMIVSLRSLKLGLVAMIPNLTPLCIVFGALGWFAVPVDIGMMMTGSIALGIAVDGTFHFLVRYEEQFSKSKNSADASRTALLQTGAPIFKAAAIAALGMLALTLSSFPPMVRFGSLMAGLLLAALIGDLVLLPAVLSLRRPPPKPEKQTPSKSSPHPHVNLRSASHLTQKE
jgi:predicted RND superfamily exporter protein